MQNITHDTMPLLREKVKQRRVVDDPVVPQDRRALLPVGPNLEVGRRRKAPVEQREDGVRFRFWHTDNPTGETRVDED